MPIWKRFDPRYYQLLIQSCLLLWGVGVLGFPVTSLQMIAVVTSALVTQIVCARWFAVPLVWLSTLNTSLSVLLLLHSQSALWLAIVALLSIASKFVLRWDNRHMFNPSAFGIVAGLLLTNEVWAAPGQWGHGLWLFLLLAGSGLVIRLGWQVMLTSISFLLTYAALLFLKAAWLGDPWTIPQHQLQNGALLLFSFFMLSDPKTTPVHPLGRVIFGMAVALLAVWMQFRLYLPNAFLYALVILTPGIIFLNRCLNYPAFEWSTSITKQEKVL